MNWKMPNSTNPSDWLAFISSERLGIVDLFGVMRAARRMRTATPSQVGWASLQNEIKALIQRRRQKVYQLQAAELCCHPRHRRATDRQIGVLRDAAHNPKAYNKALIRLIQRGNPGKPDPIQYVRCHSADAPNRALPYLGVRLIRKFAKTAPEITADTVRLERKEGWDTGFDYLNDGADFLVLVAAFKYFGPSLRDWEWAIFKEAHAEGRRARATGSGGMKNPYRKD